MSFARPGDPGQGGGHVDLELPSGGEVHATLDELRLSPAAPAKPKSPRDWHDGDTPDPDAPTKR